MAVYDAAGTRLYIGTNAAANDATTFAADTYIEINELETYSDFGDEDNLSQFQNLKDKRARKTKGSQDAGNFEFTVGRDALDAGQIAVEAAKATKFEYNFKLVVPDKKDANDTDSIIYFRGPVFRGRHSGVGAGGGTLRKNYAVAINNPIVEVPATVVA